MIEILIAGQSVALSTVSVRSLNFGQPEGGIRSASYQINVGLAKFAQVSRQFYADWVQDDREYPELANNPLDLELRAHGWPGLTTLAAQHVGLFERFALESLAFDFLQELFNEERFYRDGSGQELLYVIYIVEKVRVVDGMVHMSGTCKCN
jgi:hypothetical protein